MRVIAPRQIFNHQPSNILTWFLTTVHQIDDDCWDFLICLKSFLLLLTYTEDVSNETAKSAASETVKLEVDDGKMTSSLSRDKNRLTSL